MLRALVHLGDMDERVPCTLHLYMLHRCVLDLDVGLGLLDIDNMKKTLFDLSFKKRSAKEAEPGTSSYDL